jgi:predicted acylesterase/phospholipase RssA
MEGITMAFQSFGSSNKAIHIALLILIASSLSGCSVFTINTMRNGPLLKPVSTPPQSQDNTFIGIAMSGGGSRASNFSAAVLLELEKLGILQNTDVISSVSGSSLTAAYYGLYGNNRNPDHPWNEKGVRKAFLTDLQSGWLHSWFNPWNAMRYWLSNFTRSDIMIETLNDELYDDKQYAELIKNFPHIIINATSYTNGQPFIFTEGHFANRLNSSLDTFPLANAVMASSAFPGVFHPVTVKDYSNKNNQLAGLDTQTEHYEHLIDGGPYDNLGITSIIDLLEQREQKPKCLLIVVDAYPYAESANNIHKADTRTAADYIFDASTLLASTDTMLAKNRTLILEKTIGFDSQDVGFKAFNDNASIKFSSTNTGTKHPSPPQSCAVWHLSFQRLYDLQFEWSYARRDINKLQYLDRIRKTVNAIPTRYRLEESKNGDSPEEVQDYIFKAANILIKEDKECYRADNECTKANAAFTYQRVCNLVKAWGLTVGPDCSR